CPPTALQHQLLEHRWREPGEPDHAADVPIGDARGLSDVQDGRGLAALQLAHLPTTRSDDTEIREKLDELANQHRVLGFHRTSGSRSWREACWGRGGLRLVETSSHWIDSTVPILVKKAEWHENHLLRLSVWMLCSS